MTKNIIGIEGCIKVQGDVTHEEFLEKFVGFLDASGWQFVGGTQQHINDEDGEVIITLPDDEELKPVSTDELIKQGWDIDKIGFEYLSLKGED